MLHPIVPSSTSSKSGPSTHGSRSAGGETAFVLRKDSHLDQANDRIFLPKLGWLRYRNSREVMGTVSNITVSNRNGKWFVSLQTEREVEPPVAQGDGVGIDMGIVRFATLSDGTV